MSLNFPQDIHDGSYSTAFASGITPQDLIVPLAPSVYLQDGGNVRALGQRATGTLKNDFEVFEAQPEIIIHRQTRWKISHMPSLQDVSASEYMLISKSEIDNQKIIGVFYDKMTHMETRRIEVGDNERLYPTDCVSTVSQNGDLLYVALNKRNKASEPQSCEIHAYDLTSNLEIGFVCK